MEPEFVSLLVSDSRGSKIIPHPLPAIYPYTSEFIPIPGANILRLHYETNEFLKHNNPTNKRIFIIKLAAGICEITKKEFHDGGEELSLRPTTNVLANILDFKRSILNLGLKTLVSIATIPPVSFEDNYAYNKSVHKLWNSQYSTEDRKRLQGELFTLIKEINDEIVTENTREQMIPGIGSCRPSQLLWHINVMKESRRRKTSSLTVRIPHDLLPDGVHPNDDIIKKWSETHHNSVIQDIGRIRDLMKL